VQSRHDEHVISGGLLERRHHLRIDERAVAEEHRPQHGSPLRFAGKKRIETREQRAANARQALREGRPRPVDKLQQFAAAQRSREIDLLPREIAALVKRAGIEKIPRRPRPHQRFHSVPRTQAPRRAPEVLGAVKTQPQPAAHRRTHAARFHLLEVDFVAAAPGQRHWVFAQAALPTERRRRVEPSFGDEARDVIHGN